LMSVVHGPLSDRALLEVVTLLVTLFTDHSILIIFSVLCSMTSVDCRLGKVLPWKDDQKAISSALANQGQHSKYLIHVMYCIGLYCIQYLYRHGLVKQRWIKVKHLIQKKCRISESLY